ncbi:MAG: GNAT family N-acetyltransferase [Clostridium perfringens]|nr:GNAT family N-acetyltransferase [Clostridium perfringens]
MIKSIDNIELKKDLAYNLISDFENEVYNKNIIERIIKKIEQIPFYAYIEKGKEIGFLSMKSLTEESADIYFIKGYKLLRVKILADGKHDKLINFYRSVGFFKLEERVESGDIENKILVMIRPLI